MEATTPTPVTFPKFSALAGELRNQIWRYALPTADVLDPALTCFKPGCWRWQGAQPELEFVFRHEWLEIHIEVPLASVNREARSVALPRIRELGLVTKSRSGQFPVFVRKFNPDEDAIYVKPGQLDDVIMDAHKPQYDPWVEGRQWGTFSEYRKLAMSEASFLTTLFVEGMEEGMEGMEGIAELLQHACSVREVLVVVDAPADLESASDHDRDVKPLWKFIDAPGDAFFWHRTTRRFEICQAESVGDGVVAAIVGSEKVTKAYNDLWGSWGCLKVRPVYAVRGWKGSNFRQAREWCFG
jgi:hypothetical protein